VADRGTPPPELARCESGPMATAPVDLRVEELARELEVVWSFAPLPDGRVLIAERPGRIRVFGPEGLEAEPWAELTVSDRDEGGLMGMAVAPDFADTGHLYVMYSLDQRDAESPVRSNLRRIGMRLGIVEIPHRITRVVRLSEVEGGGGDPRVVLDRIPSGLLHAGGALAIAPGPELLVSVGDAAVPPTAQDPDDPRGAILRVRLDPATGLPPGGAREGTDPLTPLAIGLRNSQGMALLPDGSGVLLIDHGPTGLAQEARRSAKDELNLVPLDADGPSNFGWPIEAGIHEEPRFVPPLVEWSPAVAPGGMALLPDPDDPGRIQVAVAGLRGRTLRLVELVRDEGAAQGWRATCQVELLDAEWGRLRALAPHPEGGLLVGTSNRDGRGAPRDGDDRVLHLRW
jgi:glucose/arabinose dehydrogenase